MNQLDLDYQSLLKDILENGIEKNTRNGKVLSVFGRSIRYKFKDGKFPLLTTKKMAWKSICAELLWFLQGRTDLKYLLDNDCYIWVGDAYQAYLKEYLHPDGRPYTKEEFVEKIKTDKSFAKRFGNLGKIYGYQWRNWDGRIDQISELVRLLKETPDSRRMVVNAWNASDLPHQVLPPCHYGFQVYTRELSDEERVKIYERNTNTDTTFFPVLRQTLDFHNIPTRAISLMYNARSQDVPLGTPFNIASYALLLEIISKMTNMVPDELITNMGDCHIYLNQIDGVKEQLTREPYQLPKLVISNQVNFSEGIDEFLNSCLVSDFQIEGYQSHPTIKIPLSN